jgi:hypothetical protein
MTLMSGHCFIGLQAGRGDDEENPQDKGNKKDQPQAEKKKDEAGKQEDQVGGLCTI